MRVGACRNATRILVTHQTQWLHSCSRALVMQAGSIVADAPWKLLRASDTLPDGLTDLELRRPSSSPNSPDQTPPGAVSAAATPPTQRHRFSIEKQTRLQRTSSSASSPVAELYATVYATAHSGPMAPVLAELGHEEEAAAETPTAAFDSIGVLYEDPAAPGAPAQALGEAVEAEDLDVLVVQGGEKGEKGGTQHALVESIPESEVVELAAVSKSPSKAADSLGTPKRGSDGSSSVPDTCVPAVACNSCRILVLHCSLSIRMHFSLVFPD